MITKQRQHEIEQAYIAAQKMSNWLYNKAQDSAFKSLSAQINEMVREWDQTKSAIAQKTIRKYKSN